MLTSNPVGSATTAPFACLQGDARMPDHDVLRLVCSLLFAGGQLQHLRCSAQCEDSKYWLPARMLATMSLCTSLETLELTIPPGTRLNVIADALANLVRLQVRSRSTSTSVISSLCIQACIAVLKSEHPVLTLCSC